MLWVQKLAGFLLQPSTWIALALALSLRSGFQLRPRGARRWTLVAFGLYFVFGLFPLDDVLVAQLERRFPRPDLTGTRVDGIIVLGGSEGVGNDRVHDVVSVNEAGERVIETAILARRFPNARVVALGGGNPLTGLFAIESEVMSRVLVSLGIERSRILLERTSRTTWENALLGVPLIGAKPSERWVLVTSAWHMPRAVGVFRKQGLDVIPFPVDYQTGKKLEPWRLHTAFSIGLGNLDGIVREYPALVYYRLLGRTNTFFPGP